MGITVNKVKTWVYWWNKHPYDALMAMRYFRKQRDNKDESPRQYLAETLSR